MFVLFWHDQPIGVVQTEEEVEAVRAYFKADGSDRAMGSILHAEPIPETFDPTGPKRYVVGHSYYYPRSQQRTRETVTLYLTFDETDHPDVLTLDYDGEQRRWRIAGSVMAPSRREAMDLTLRVARVLYDGARDRNVKSVSWYGGTTFVAHDPETDVFKKEDA